MSDAINLMIRDNGVATVYDDTYDITIHCENEEEQRKVVELLKSIPSAQPEPTKLIQDTKTVPSNCHYVDLAEKVTATFFSDESEEWTQQTCTIEDVLSAVCDDYTIVSLSSAQPERKTGKWILSDAQNPEDVRNGNYAYTCSSCLHSDIHAKTVVVPFCWHCGANMRGEQDERQSK